MVGLLAERANIQPPISVSENVPMEKQLLLPKKNQDDQKVIAYLSGREIDKEIISVDVYGDTQEIIEDCLDVLEPFIESVIPKEQESQYYDYSDTVEIDLIIEEYFHVA